MSRFAVLLAGPVRPTADLAGALSGRRIIAADRGLIHATALGLAPELWIGDFDSAAPDAGADFPDVPRQSFPRDKDKTDGELAIEAAIARGADDILLVGALGGARSDHAFMHLILALRYFERGIAIEVFDGRERAWPLLSGTRTVDCRAGAQFSILKFDRLEGLTIDGAKWPLRNVDVPFLSILTQSNEATGPIRISLRRGTAILVVQAENELD